MVHWIEHTLYYRIDYHVTCSTLTKSYFKEHSIVRLWVVIRYYIKFNYSAYHQDINVENERNIIKQAHSFGSPLKDYTKNIYFANQCRFCVKLIEVTNMRWTKSRTTPMGNFSTVYLWGSESRSKVTVKYWEDVLPIA